MNNKQNLSQFDINKVCRACLTEEGEMRSVFLPDDSVGPLRLAEMLMGFSAVHISTGDGLPELICLQCVHQVSRAFTFKQLCERSETSLRQYLGKPLETTVVPLKSCKEEDTIQVTNDFYDSQMLSFDNFQLDTDDSEDGSDDDKIDPLLTEGIPEELNPNDEKVIAQRQLIRASKFAHVKVTTKRNKLLTNKLSKSGLAKKLKRNKNQCNVCKKTFVNLNSFKKHLKTHIEDRPYKCKLCSRAFTEENYLNNHMRTHIPEEQKPHECNVCKRRFIHQTLLNKHLLKHSGEKPFVCKICNKGCYAENSLLKHMKIHEKKEGDPAMSKHICDYCRREFLDAETLAVHIKQHTGDRPFLCNTCGKCFPQRFNLELHLRTHTGERPFECEICRNGYVSKASLKIHMRTHTNERPFACEFCGKAFRQSGDLTSHKRLHGTEKPIECSVCQKRFTTVMKLKYHMRNHTGERPYVCSVCGRGFTVNTILLRHMRVHSGERPYVCVTCGKAFSQSSTLNTHMKVHAPSPKYQDQSNNLRKFNQADSNSRVTSDLSRAMLPAADNRMLANEGSRLLTAHITTDTRLLTNDNRLLTNENTHLLTNDGQRLLVNEAPRLLINENTRLLTQDNRLLTNDNTRLLVNDNTRLLVNENSRHLVLENSRQLLTDKYLTNYDPYHRGQL